MVMNQNSKHPKSQKMSVRGGKGVGMKKKGRESEEKVVLCNSEENELEVPEEEFFEEFIRLDFLIASSSSLGTDGSDTWHRRLGNGQLWQQALGSGQLGNWLMTGNLLGTGLG